MTRSPFGLSARVAVGGAVAGGVLGLSLACGGGQTPAGPRSNAAACAEWVEHMNGLGCTSVTYETEEMCAAADLSPAGMAQYYDCARENARCDADQLVLDWSGCRQPTMEGG